jgi:hypothetical protein
MVGVQLPAQSLAALKKTHGNAREFLSRVQCCQKVSCGCLVGSGLVDLETIISIMHSVPFAFA